MRVVFIHPSYHSGSAEVAGNWPPAWVAYLGGALKSAEVRSVAGDDQSFTIKSNPLAMPVCPWNCAVFERIFATLTATQVSILYHRCQAKGDDCGEWAIKAATGSLRPGRMSRRAAADRPDREDRPLQAWR